MYRLIIGLIRTVYPKLNSFHHMHPLEATADVFTCLPPILPAMMKISFFPDTIRLWNSLPQLVVDAPSIDVLKARVGDITFC